MPSVPGLVLEDELARALDGPNKHLQATALRTRAVISLRAGEPSDNVLMGLQQSLCLFEEVGNPLETARTKLHIAVCFEQQGLVTRAAAVRQEALHTLAFFEQRKGRVFFLRSYAPPCAITERSFLRRLSRNRPRPSPTRIARKPCTTVALLCGR